MRSLPLLLALACGLVAPSASVAAPLVAAGDADMAPTAYVDGNLDPRVPGDVDRFDAPREPTVAEFSPDGRRVLIASRDPRRPLTVVEVRGERFRERRSFGLTTDAGATHATWRPDGRQIAVVVGDPRREVRFYSFKGSSLVFVGGPVQVEPRPFTGFYTPDGRTYITNSVRIGGGTPVPEPGAPVDPAAFAGALAVIDVRGTPRVVQTVTTPIFPEGLAISPDGRRVRGDPARRHRLRPERTPARRRDLPARLGRARERGLDRHLAARRHADARTPDPRDARRALRRLGEVATPAAARARACAAGPRAPAARRR